MSGELTSNPADHLEGDGLIDDVFGLLWCRDPLADSHVKVAIPDTVIFREGK